MSQKSHKTDVRIYIEDDYKAYLKLIAKEQNISVNQLVMKLLVKKYPFDKKARAVLEARVAEATLPLPKKEVTDNQEEDVEVFIQSETDTAVSSDIHIDESLRRQQEARLREVNTRLNQAVKGDKLPYDEYQRLKQEQAELRAILNHN